MSVRHRERLVNNSLHILQYLLMNLLVLLLLLDESVQSTINTELNAVHIANYYMTCEIREGEFAGE